MTDKEFDNRNRLAVWKNEDRQKETHPTHKGSGEVVCEECNHVTPVFVSGWARRKGESDRKPAMSLSIEPKPEKYREPKGGASSQPMPEDFDEDIPF